MGDIQKCAIPVKGKTALGCVQFCPIASLRSKVLCQSHIRKPCVSWSGDKKKKLWITQILKRWLFRMYKSVSFLHGRLTYYSNVTRHKVSPGPHHLSPASVISEA